MKVTKAALVLLFVLCAAHLRADIININLAATGGAVNFKANKGTQDITFSGLTLRTTDSANDTGLSLTPGTSGYFHFTTVSGGQGLFSTPTGATFTAGTAASGILRGSISSIVLTGATRVGTTTTFTMQLTLSNMTFQNCTGGCVNSTSLQTFSHAPTGTLNISFTMPNNVTTLAGLLGMNGNRGSNTLSGAMDATVTPEPASLALFGTGLLVIGMRLTRHRKKPE